MNIVHIYHIVVIEYKHNIWNFVINNVHISRFGSIKPWKGPDRKLSVQSPETRWRSLPVAPSVLSQLLP